MEQMKQNVVGWFEIYVEDIDRAKKFYEAVLDKTLADMTNPDDMDDHKMVVFPWDEKLPGATGALVQMKEMKAGNNSTIVYFNCEDCELEQNRIEAAGGKVMQAKFSIGEHGYCALGIDTEGNCFGLHSMK